MAVMKIKAVSIIGRMNELERVTAICGESAAFHPDNPLSFYSDTSDFIPLSEENPYAVPLQRLTAAISGAHKKLELLPKRDGEDFQFEGNELENYVNSICEGFDRLQSQRSSAQQRIQQYTSDMEKMKHFVGLDLNLDEIHDCKFIKVRFGSLPKDSFDKLQGFTQNPYVIFFPSTSDGQHYWGVYFAPIDQVSEVDRIFSSLYFERIRLAELRSSPEQVIKELSAMREREIEQIKQADRDIEALWKREQKHCLRIYTWLNERSVYFGIRRYAARYNDNFILTGWTPEEEEAKLRARLDQLESVEYTFDSAEDELIHSPPVKLKNKPVFRPFEFFVDMYGLPNYNEPDPTAFVAVTYILLFGIMFGDVGQGLVVSLAGWLMWKLKKLKIGKILLPCGISSFVFGFVYGSVFGYEDALNPLYHAVFGLEEKPIEVMNPDTMVQILLSAVGIGIVLVLIAILINIFSSLKRRDYTSGLFGPNGVAGLVFYGSAIVGFGGQLALGWNLISVPYIILLLIAPLLVMMFREVLGGLLERRSDWKPESWGGFVMENFFEVFEFLLSYVSNTISFLRVGAFVLVHAGMMIMVSTLSGMATGVVYALIVVIGNVIVIGMEGLLVCIQVLRLEFYEMFSRFFDGGGRAFHPVTVRNEQA